VQGQRSADQGRHQQALQVAISGLEGGLSGQKRHARSSPWPAKQCNVFSRKFPAAGGKQMAGSSASTGHQSSELGMHKACCGIKLPHLAQRGTRKQAAPLAKVVGGRWRRQHPWHTHLHAIEVWEGCETTCMAGARRKEAAAQKFRHAAGLQRRLQMSASKHHVAAALASTFCTTPNGTTCTKSAP